MRKDIQPEIVHDALAQKGHDVDLEILDEEEGCIDRQKDPGDDKKTVDVSLRNIDVESPLDDLGKRHGKDGSQKEKDDGHSHEEFHFLHLQRER